MDDPYTRPIWCPCRDKGRDKGLASRSSTGTVTMHSGRVIQTVDHRPRRVTERHSIALLHLPQRRPDQPRQLSRHSGRHNDALIKATDHRRRTGHHATNRSPFFGD
jgi:predicted ABC-class ATPase